MNDLAYIDKDRALTTAQDYEILRSEGQKYIEALAHKLWTDFNAHDPGITILEVLCYAITELGYRCNFDIKDLLADEQGIINNKSFFTAHEILTNAPLTPLDYRKLLIDVEGVNNAWFIYSDGTKNAMEYWNPLPNEVPLYINLREDKLSFESTDSFGNDLEQLLIRGLNKIIVELGEDLKLGQLNDVSVDHVLNVVHSGSTHYVMTEVELEFDGWHHPKASWLNVMSNPEKIDIETIVVNGNRILIRIHKVANHTETLELKIRVVDSSETELAEGHLSTVDNIAKAIEKFEVKRGKVNAVYEEIYLQLNKNRNLMEDWLCLETVTNVEIGVCADVDIAADADAEEVLARIQEAIDLILDPPIRFYTLHQMLNEGYPPEQIFNGPSLKHGFLKDEEVQNAKLPNCIHASDLVAAIMNLEGVKAVNNLLLTAYNSEGNPIEDAMNKSWCLQLSGEQKPVFNFNRSKLLLFRDGIPFIIPEYGEYEMNQGIFYLKTENNTYKLQAPEIDFAHPKGQYYQLDHYYSIQNDFPVTYGIGKGNLLETELDPRKAQAKQLKAYLQHFDQLLADFFKQLYHAKELLDINPVDRTYFVQQLKEISGIDEDWFVDEVYGDSFEDVLLNGINEDDRSFYENDKLFFDRRNRFLDHLIARFGESFSDYVFMMHTMQKNAKGLAEISMQNEELIEDKEQFLSQYPAISYPRGLGINYLQKASTQPEHPWRLGNRGGFERRIAALLGIDNIVLGDIVDDIPKANWTYVTELGPLEFTLLNTNPFSMEERWELAHMLINNVTSYKVVTFTNSYIYFVDSDHTRIAKYEHTFETSTEAEKFIPKLYRALNSHLENFYCLEHILLRPLFEENLEDKDLMTVCLNDNCYSEANNDPYSFKATVVLPGWLARFRNRYFRRYAERLIRSEAPAHVLLKICWVGQEDMIGFQKAYKEWIDAYRKIRSKLCIAPLSTREKNAYNQSLSRLVVQLKRLKTIYDEGTLHDCLESELTNPISLNNSSLGTLKNIEP